MGEISQQDDSINPDDLDKLRQRAEAALFHFSHLVSELGEEEKINLDENLSNTSWKKADTLRIGLEDFKKLVDYLTPEMRMEALGYMAQAEIYLADHRAKLNKKAEQ